MICETETHNPTATEVRLRRAIHAWIREDAPVPVKLHTTPQHINALIDRVVKELAS